MVGGGGCGGRGFRLLTLRGGACKMRAMKTRRTWKLNGKTVTATVNYIAVRDSYATWKATKETGMYDAKTFEVRAVPDQGIEGIRPGMSAIMK